MGCAREAFWTSWTSTKNPLRISHAETENLMKIQKEFQGPVAPNREKTFNIEKVSQGVW